MSSTYFSKFAQDRLTKNFVFYRFADKKRLPKNSGQIMQFYRYVQISGTGSLTKSGAGGVLTLSGNGSVIRNGITVNSGGLLNTGSLTIGACDAEGADPVVVNR